MYIWKRKYDPFVLGGPTRYNIKTRLQNFKIIDLGKGFQGVYIEENGSAGVYELESGGLVGDTIKHVMDDIAACDDISLMQDQISEAKKELVSAREVAYEDFFR